MCRQSVKIEIAALEVYHRHLTELHQRVEANIEELKTNPGNIKKTEEAIMGLTEYKRQLSNDIKGLELKIGRASGWVEY